MQANDSLLLPAWYSCPWAELPGEPEETGTHSSGTWWQLHCPSPSFRNLTQKDKPERQQEESQMGIKGGKARLWLLSHATRTDLWSWKPSLPGLSSVTQLLQGCVIPDPINLAFLSAQQHCFKREMKGKHTCLPASPRPPFKGSLIRILPRKVGCFKNAF